MKLALVPKGGWQYVQTETGFNIQGKNGADGGNSFWMQSRRLARHRAGNKLAGATFDQAQRDILTYTRNALGLPDETKVIQSSDQNQFKETRQRCAHCGKKAKKVKKTKTVNL